MEGKMIHLRVPDEVYKHLDVARQELYFESVPGLIKELLRKFIVDSQRNEAIKHYKKIQGTGQKNPLNLETYERTREESGLSYLKKLKLNNKRKILIKS